MDAADIAATLQMQFAGQLVLYVPDMAKIFGKSEKAITSLISRDGLPFKVKFLGSRQCVDIFQVAGWLASTNGAAEEVTQSTSAIESMPTRKSSRKSTKGSPVAVANLDSTLMTPMAQALLAMRHDRAEDIERYAARFVGDEKDFLLGVAQAVSGRGPRYRVTVAVGDISIEGASSEQATLHHSLRDAELELVDRLTDARYVSPQVPTTLILLDGRRTLFRCVVSGHSFDVQEYELRFDLPGL